MAITKTTKVERVEVYAPQDLTADDTANAKHEMVMAVYLDTIDDSEDADLPILHTRIKTFQKFKEDGGALTDYAGEDTLVKAVCAAVWA